MQARFIGTSNNMLQAYKIIGSAAASAAPVLITGETGTGKELAATDIHEKSARNAKPMIVLNCAAIPHELIESEIFGHVRGAFTGATSDRDGAATMADKSTLFLDEISEMPIELQAKLLRFVQTGVFTPVGGRKSIKADIRFIAATNRAPLDAVKEGQLREDLYYRLAVIQLPIPPLRNRGVDILMLAKNFLAEASARENKTFDTFSDDAQGLLLAHAWPGNVRELENTIRNAVIMNDGPILTGDMLCLPLALHEKKFLNPFTFVTADDIRPFSEIERDVIENAIRICDGNISDAARRLKINPSTIHRKQKEWRNG